MSTPDEKVCPFCAATIKAAAVKCPFCRSDLPEYGPGGSVAGAPVLEVVTASDLPPAEAPLVPGGRGRVLNPVVALLVLVCLLLGAATVWLALDDPADADPAPVATLTTPGRVVVPSTSGLAVPADDPAVAEASRAATVHAAAVLSYGYKSLAQDRARARAMMTDGFRADYDKVMNRTAPSVRKNRFTLRATAVATSLVSLDPDRAVALLFVNSVITSKDSPGRQTDRSRVLMSLTRQDGKWIVSQIDALLIN